MELLPGVILILAFNLQFDSNWRLNVECSLVPFLILAFNFQFEVKLEVKLQSQHFLSFMILAFKLQFRLKLELKLHM